MSNAQKEILEAVDNLIRVHDEWVANPDPRFKDAMPQEFDSAANELFNISAVADVPAQLRELVFKIDQFEVEWKKYADGDWEQGGKPHASLLTALRALFHARSVTAELRPKLPEPVSVLLAQKVSPFQIANAIYGYNGVGPFLENGNIRHDLIEQEGKTPGSVVPAGWIPPYEEDRLRKHHFDTRNRLKAMDQKAAVPVQRPETIDGLLREGQFVDVIADVCNVTEAQVRQIAKILGLEVKIRGNVAAERAPQEPDVNPEAITALEAGSVRPKYETPKAVVKVSRAARQHVVELAASGLDAGAIAKEVGQGMTPGAVSKILREARTPAK